MERSENVFIIFELCWGSSLSHLGQKLDFWYETANCVWTIITATMTIENIFHTRKKMTKTPHDLKKVENLIDFFEFASKEEERRCHGQSWKTYGNKMTRKILLNRKIFQGCCSSSHLTVVRDNLIQLTQIRLMSINEPLYEAFKVFATWRKAERTNEKHRQFRETKTTFVVNFSILARNFHVIYCERETRTVFWAFQLFFDFRDTSI